jgi:hypothetical protein
MERATATVPADREVTVALQDHLQGGHTMVVGQAESHHLTHFAGTSAGPVDFKNAEWVDSPMKATVDSEQRGKRLSAN